MIGSPRGRDRHARSPLQNRAKLRLSESPLFTKPRKTLSILRRHKVGIAITLGLMLVVSFQNFTSIPLERLRPDFPAAHASSPTDGTADIRNIAPYRAPASEAQIFATPPSGTDANAIGQDWLSREAHLITGGADERFIQDLNKKLNAYVNDTEETGVPSTGRNTASAFAAPSVNDDEPTLLDGMKIHSLQLMSLNHFKINLANRTEINCAVQGDGVQLNVTRAISQDFDFTFHAETAGSKSSVSLNYRW